MAQPKALRPNVTVPELLDELRAQIVRKTGKPIDPDVDFLTTQIELRSSTEPTIMRGQEYGLTLKQCELFAHLARRPGMAYSREAIINALYFHCQEQPSPKLLDVMILKIRTRLRERDAPCWIETAWGIGFRYVDTPARLGYAKQRGIRQCGHEARAA